MLYRRIEEELVEWCNKQNRKPLILKGARQVGKTTAVNVFGERFKQYLYFNLEKKEDRDIFDQDVPFAKLVEALFFYRNMSPSMPSTLIFIDEIQNSPKAIESLRFFFEEHPELPVIAAGSLLEVVLEKYHLHFPVGRVEYLYMYPMTFHEYLLGTQNASMGNLYRTEVPLPEYTHSKFLSLFHEYALIGGMPEAVNSYVQHRDLKALQSVYEGLLVSYTDDVGKYARNETAYQVLRHVIESAPFETGNRIRFHSFGKSNYRSREAGEALRTLERVMLLYMLYPVTSGELPLLVDKRKSPRLQYIDTGLLNYAAGLSEKFMSFSDLNSIYQGKAAEHVVGQELLAKNLRDHRPPTFWVREKPGSTAEIDFLYEYRGMAVPVEVKSGKTGTLRSLLRYMDETDVPVAVRLYADVVQKQIVHTPSGREFILLNLPYYLCGVLDLYIEWALSG
jgi:uncharacterized protein